ncbi:MAG: DUF1697 domain-containing protein [Flavobacteriales bacterium]|nr:DUF1697 domain-containing protein [Flavobacteriales bacterium]
MNTYISILRGINVSGQKKIKMADLKKLYESLGFENVETHIQSGNVVFTSPEKDPKKLEQLIFNGIQKAYGFDVPNLILTPQEIEDALKHNPYQDIELMYFTFLEEFPAPENIDKLSTYQFPEEYYELKGKVIYSHFPNGAGRAKMNNNFFEQKLKVMATSRNLNTVKKLLEMAQ